MCCDTDFFTRNRIGHKHLINKIPFVVTYAKLLSLCSHWSLSEYICLASWVWTITRTFIAFSYVLRSYVQLIIRRCSQCDIRINFTPYNRVLEKPTVVHLVKKLIPFYGALSFVPVFTYVSHWSTFLNR